MAAAGVRAHTLLFVFFLQLCLSVSAAPSLLVLLVPPKGTLVARDLVLNNVTGTPQIFDTPSSQAIPQGPATDGGGSGRDLAFWLWVGFCCLVGPPMSIAGIRGWRFTTGVGIGLSASVCSWAAIINSVNNNGVPDAVLTLIVFGFFFLGFVTGLFEFARVAGMTALSICGGLAIGMRIVIIKEGLLLSDPNIYGVNWLIVAVFGVTAGLLVAFHRAQRVGLCLSSASVGTFLIAIAVDTLLNRQDGISRGLRTLFDRNTNHALDIIFGTYKPPLSSQIIIAVSIGLTPILAYLQHRIFRAPFSRKPKDRPISDLPPFGAQQIDHVSKPAAWFAELWDGAKLQSTKRFSL